MEPSSVLVKTAKGLEEIDKRTHKLAGRLRAVLIMVDGQRPLSDLLDQAGALADQLAGQLDELVAGGYIRELAPPAPVQQAVNAAPAAAAGRAEAAEPRPAAAAPAAPRKAAPPWTSVPIPIHKARLNKMLTETLGMRAMFVAGQLEGINGYAELESWIDDIARSVATSNGPDAGHQWRDQARTLIGIA